VIRLAEEKSWRGQSVRVTLPTRVEGSATEFASVSNDALCGR